MTEDFDMENLSQAIVLGASAIGAGLAMIAGLGPVSYTHLRAHET